MRTAFFNILLIFFLAACRAEAQVTTPSMEPASFAGRSSLTGAWLGALTHADGSVESIALAFDESNSTFNIEPLVKTWPLTLTQNETGIHFSVAGVPKDPFRQIEFTGSLSNGILSGEMHWDDEIAPVTFTPIASVDPSILENYEGVYRFESGRALSIIVNPSFDANGLKFFHDGLTMTDFSNGDSRGIYPLDDFTFAVGALRVVGAPLAGRLQFIVDEQGKATGLMWWDKLDGITPSSTSGQFAARVPFTYEDITFTSADGTLLAGRVTLPPSDEPLPAIVMLHGSEPGTRDNFGSKLMSHYMVSQGIAILNTDKRGVGESEGVYQESPSEKNVDDLADDAIAGAEYLAGRSEIDAKRIGLIGGSQAGWIIPVAAAKSELISYTVIISGPVLSFAQEDRYSSVTNDGDTLTTYDVEKLDQTLREMKPGGVDPIPVISELSQPGLWLWGSTDKSVPVTVSAENLQAIIDDGKTNFSYQIFPNADHNLNISPNGLFDEIPYSPGVVFYSALSEWLEKNVK